MKRILLLTVVIAMALSANSQSPAAYKIFDSQGNQVSFAQMIKTLNGADVVFFGEEHNNPISHWLELEVTKALYRKHEQKLVMGAEMFEADVQLIVNEYLQGFIREKDVRLEARVWPNYPTDYRPLLEFAKKHDLQFIATNIPRRYANLVYRRGLKALDSLSAAAKKYIAPLPIAFDSTLECYSFMIHNAIHMGMPGSTKLAEAQAIKDATMAYFISKNYRPGWLFLHFNGSYHSDNHQGIVWYLRRYKPSLKVLTITTVDQKNLKSLKQEYKGRADFIIVVPNDMTKTY